MQESGTKINLNIQDVNTLSWGNIVTNDKRKRNAFRKNKNKNWIM